MFYFSNSFSALSAASISACFLFLPFPTARTFPFNFTSAVNVLSWSGPSSLIISYSIFTFPCTCNFSCRIVLWSFIPTFLLAISMSSFRLSTINYSQASSPESKYIAAITASTLSAIIAGFLFPSCFISLFPRYKKSLKLCFLAIL